MRERRAIGWLALGYLALTIVLAYPLPLHAGDHVLSPGTDTNLFVWTLAWDLHAIVHQPLAIFDANIFYPFTHVLAYSENLLGAALLVAPVSWLTGNPVLAMNVAALVTAPLCAIGGYVLARRLGISRSGAAIAGLVYGFSPPRFFRLDQLHLASVEWIPFSLAYAHAYLERRRPRDLRVALALFAWQALTSGHGAVFLAIALAGLFLYRVALGDPPDLLARAREAGATGALVVAPVVLLFLPYRTVQVEMGLRRTLADWQASWTSFLASPSHVQHWLLAHVLPGVEVSGTADAYLFPGVIAIGLAVIGAFWRSERGVVWRRAAGALDGAIVIACAAALYGAIAPDPRIRAGSVVLLSVRRPWRAWAIGGAAAALRIGIARRVALAASSTPRRNDMALFYTLLFSLCVWLSLGPPLGAWRFVYWLPVFNFIRVPSRFMILGMLALAALAGFGFDCLTRGWPARARTAAAVVLGGLIVAECAAIPFGLTRLDPSPPAIDRWLASRPKPFAVAEVPVPDSGRFMVREERASIYMLHSMAHWQKTVHGYSGLVPESSDELYQALAHFPDGRSLRLLSAIGVRYIVVHPAAYPDGAWPAAERQIGACARLTLEHAEADGRVYSLHR